MYNELDSILGDKDFRGFKDIRIINIGKIDITARFGIFSNMT